MSSLTQEDPPKIALHMHSRFKRASAENAEDLDCTCMHDA